MDKSSVKTVEPRGRIGAAQPSDPIPIFGKFHGDETRAPKAAETLTESSYPATVPVSDDLGSGTSRPDVTSSAPTRPAIEVVPLPSDMEAESNRADSMGPTSIEGWHEGTKGSLLPFKKKPVETHPEDLPQLRERLDAWTRRQRRNASKTQEIAGDESMEGEEDGEPEEADLPEHPPHDLGLAHAGAGGAGLADNEEHQGQDRDESDSTALTSHGESVDAAGHKRAED